MRPTTQQINSKWTQELSIKNEKLLEKMNFFETEEQAKLSPSRNDKRQNIYWKEVFITFNIFKNMRPWPGSSVDLECRPDTLRLGV